MCGGLRSDALRPVYTRRVKTTLRKIVFPISYRELQYSCGEAGDSRAVVRGGSVLQTRSSKEMASSTPFSSEQTSSAVGSRRSRVAAFGDETSDQFVASSSRSQGQLSPDEQGVSTSSGETIFRSEGEPIRGQTPVAQCACDPEAWGAHLPCLHLKCSFASAATAGDE